MKRETGTERRRWRLRDIWLVTGTVLLAFWIMFVTVSTLTLQTLDERNRASMRGTLDYDAFRLESRLRQMENFLKVTLISDARFGRLRNSSLGYADSLRQAAVQMDAWCEFFTEFSGVFFYDSSRDVLIQKQWNDISSYSMSSVVRRLVMRVRMKALCVGEEQAVDTWIIENLEGLPTAFYIYPYRGQYLGVYVSLDGLWERIMDLEKVAGFERSGLADAGGWELTGERSRVFDLTDTFYREQGKRYFQQVRRIEGFPAVIVALAPGRQNWTIWWAGLILLSAVSGLFLMFLLQTLQRDLFAPLSGLNRQMKIFSGGKLDCRMSNPVGCQEVRELSRTFNEMTEQIRDMKIENYEKLLERQETLLKYLQIQKNPHFFLNMLNVIYSLAASEHIAQIRKITLELIRHVRYVLSVDTPLVPLAQELEFTRNYLEIQRVRFPYEIRLEEEGLQEEALQVQVPPLLVQTFVENAFKYGLSGEETLEIRLEAELEEETLRLRISDRGPGFPEKMLEELNTSGTVCADARGEHIGIHNVLSRMKLLYGNTYGYRFENLPDGGAQVELILPRQV